MITGWCASRLPHTMTLMAEGRLTARETEVLRLIARGYSYAQAAGRLGLSPHTVASHIKKIYRKLGVHSSGAAVLQATRLGIIE
jgi:DNA-binding CsgD family transcriptional regulator